MIRIVKRKISGAILLVAVSCFFSLAPGMVAEAQSRASELTVSEFQTALGCTTSSIEDPPWNQCDVVATLAIGQGQGAAAMLKNLHCVFNHPKCGCMESALETTSLVNDRFINNFGAVVNGVSGSTQMGVVGYEAMNRTCR